MANWTFLIYSSLSVIAITFLYQATAGAIYRLYYSPISHIPGPKLAALTFWYEFYYDVILRGQYLFHLRTLHAKYGPIIRINPYEVHISDPYFYDSIYASSGEKQDKWEWSAKELGLGGTMIATIGHDHHKARRAAVNPFFSMASVRKLQPVIEERVAKLIERVRGFKKADGEVLKFNNLFSAFTNDVVMEYCYGYSQNLLENDNLNLKNHDAYFQMGKSAALLRHMYWIFQLMQGLPNWLATLISPSLGLIIELRQRVENEIILVKAQQPHSTTNQARAPHPVIFHEILKSKLPESDKTVRHLRDASLTIVGAGTMTTAWILSVATYHLISSPRILSKLKAELKSAIPNANTSVPIELLESLPYLVAVVQEALRLGVGVASRLQRVSPEKPIVFIDRSSGTDSGKKKWIIPPQTPVAISSYYVHHDESIFPDAESFIPERWIENPRLSRFLVSFSKGSRQCLGINLAYAEIYLCLVAIFRRFGSAGQDSVVVGEDDEGVLELFETSLKDVEIAVDFFISAPVEESKGIRIKVKPLADR